MAPLPRTLSVGHAWAHRGRISSARWCCGATTGVLAVVTTMHVGDGLEERDDLTGFFAAGRSRGPGSGGWCGAAGRRSGSGFVSNPPSRRSLATEAVSGTWLEVAPPRKTWRPLGRPAFATASTPTAATTYEDADPPVGQRVAWSRTDPAASCARPCTSRVALRPSAATVRAASVVVSLTDSAACRT